MAVLVDPPRWPAHGRLWAHLVSDVSLEELHTFAGRVGIPRRGFEGDHYDVPGERLDDLLAAGAQLVPARDLLRRLVASGLRVPQQRGQRVLCSWLEMHRDGSQRHVDLVVCAVGPPASTTRGTRGLALVGDGLLLRRTPGGWDLPVVEAGSGSPIGFSRRRPLARGGAPAPSSSWRHLALVQSADVPAVHDVVPVPLADAALRGAGLAWWPLVEHVVSGRPA